MQSKHPKILLALLPFWSPLIPPMGIACLKSFLQRHGCEVKAADLNIVDHLRIFYDRYFNFLREYVPKDNLGNFYVSLQHYNTNERRVVRYDSNFQEVDTVLSSYDCGFVGITFDRENNVYLTQPWRRRIL